MSDPRLAQITISRTSSNIGGSYIGITMTDGSSRCQMIRIRIDFAEFAEAITGHGCIPCSYEMHSEPEYWGLVREHKTERFDKGSNPYGAKRRAYLQECVKPYEVDGWKANIGWAMATKQDGDKYQVLFERYVEPDDAASEG